jgi:lipoprotein NlpD
MIAARFIRVACAAVCAAMLAGCMTRPPAPVDDRAPMMPSRPHSTAAPPTAAAPTPREPETAPQTYTVKRGETLAQIALDHGLDYRELAMWNNIENPNVIRVGQVLVLSGTASAGSTVSASGTSNGTPSGTTTTPLVTSVPVPTNSEPRPVNMATSSTGKNTASYKSEPKAVKLPYSEQALAQLKEAPPPAPPPPMPAPTPAIVPATTTPPAVVATAPTSAAAAAAGATAAAPAKGESSRVPEIDGEKTEWVWPATGKIVSGFSDTSTLKGIDIAGKAGQPVMASASGKVVYAGTGLRGYGKLIIVKHNATYLSTYAHNREILVKEGQSVTKGQKIAEMGDSDADQVKLHFEIRRLGKPIDPVKMLPPA